ncbi:hypothetical protein EJ04DRAFT_466374 [Polyplosphaeria fusca]|uniref:Glycosyl transferase CAP10 domain-containing protein n=1 Tax=Polyplosphaeria fusca TaxID=682080 RepID=A0A9P4V2R5_9PLEO|nr:hypothetical protein EJ04DRAFT_466374 [Polyplosphaeria fusca]
MDRKWLLFPCGLVTGTGYLSTAVDTSFAFDRPLHSIGVLLLFSGLTILAYDAWTTPRRPSTLTNQYRLIPLDDGAGRAVTRDPSPTGPIGARARASDSRKRLILACLLLAIICSRLAVFWRVQRDDECTSPTALVLIPLVLALYHSTLSPSGCMVDFWPDHIFYVLSRGTSRYILPSLLLCVGSFMVSWRAGPLRSSFICPITTSAVTTIPRLQFFGTFLDCAAVLIIFWFVDQEALSNQDGPTESFDVSKLHVLGVTIIASSAALAVAGFIAFWAEPTNREWFLPLHYEYLRHLLRLVIVIPCMIICFFSTARINGVMSTSLLMCFSAAFTGVFWAFRTGVESTFPPKATAELVVYLLVLTVALGLYVLVDSKTENRLSSRAQFRLGRYQALLLILLLCIIWLGGFGYQFSRRRDLTNDHPIAILVKSADSAHERWLSRVKRSRTLLEAVRNYQDRYSRDPPPGFDKWYEFATSRDSAIIDDFDNIDLDLMPFSSLSAAELRKKTGVALAEGSQIGGIKIRGGKAGFVMNGNHTESWVMDGTIRMMENFVDFLPDMDIAINLDHTPRIGLPFSSLRQADSQRQIYPERGSINITVDFSPDRGSTWDDVPVDLQQSHGSLSPHSHPGFSSYGFLSCPPDSRARRESHWTKRNLCTSCAAPHSLGVFVSNWTTSADPCHQPDLSHLHGFYLGSTAHAITHDLIPVFSQSRAQGFADIRFPSPWNYMDKEKYSFDEKHPDPPFIKKENILFWRGADTEATSTDTSNHPWRGMLRQRLVHLTNYETNSHAILLPTRRGTFAYHLDRPRTIMDELSTTVDIRFTNISNCGMADCAAQMSEFGVMPDIDFRQHWRYKFLFDTDGAGPSGRFIPFLRSNSVVFKSSLFREWYDGRLAAWKHFVPVDLRLHDLFSSLAYFGGYGLNEGSKVTMEAKEKAAEKITRESKVWSEKVLRKEDMEIYLFRLLLEWGRLTDDRRVELGFRMPHKKGAGGKGS